MTPNGQDGTQYPQPLQTSGWTMTVSNSVRISAPVGQASRQPAFEQCLQTSDMNTQRSSSAPSAATSSPPSVADAALPSATSIRLGPTSSFGPGAGWAKAPAVAGRSGIAGVLTVST